MNKTSVEGKVGLFVFITLLLTAGLLLYFSKGLNLFTPTYEIKLWTSNVGGIKAKSSVLMAGIPVGTVEEAILGPAGTNVMLSLQIRKKYQIYTNALFVIEQSGFLGDQYVAVYPRPGRAPALQPGDSVTCQEPFNLQEVARSAAGFIRRIDETARKLNDSLARIDRLVLNEETLTNISFAVSNFRNVAERAVGTVEELDELINTNRAPVNAAISNLVTFSDQMNITAAELRQLVATNEAQVNATVKNIESASGMMNSLLADLQAGKGLAGSLLKNEQSERDFSMLLEHLNTVSSNLTVTTSNLNKHGLWWMLWKPKPARSTPMPPPSSSKGGGI